MEALKLKIENLEWEMNRLDSENKKLREQHPEKAKRVDAETELEQAQGDAARLTEQLKVYEEQLARIRGTLTDTEKRATEAEEMAANAEERVAESGRKAAEVEANAQKRLHQETQSLKEAHASLEEELVTCTGDTLIVCVDVVISGESARFCNTDDDVSRIAVRIGDEDQIDCQS